MLKKQPHKIIPLFALFLSNAVLHAQTSPKVYADLQCLHSTHGNNFWGISLAGDRSLSKNLSLGIGFEYTYATKHFDNDWMLYNLNFLPVYTEQRYLLLPARKASPFIHLEEGISFNQYDKTYPSGNAPPEKIHEQGLYLQGGMGLQWKISPRHSILTECAIKSFKTSTNNLDVNPHGLNIRLAYSFG